MSIYLNENETVQHRESYNLIVKALVHETNNEYAINVLNLIKTWIYITALGFALVTFRSFNRNNNSSPCFSRPKHRNRKQTVKNNSIYADSSFSHRWLFRFFLYFWNSGGFLNFFLKQFGYIKDFRWSECDALKHDNRFVGKDFSNNGKKIIIINFYTP